MKMTNQQSKKFPYGVANFLKIVRENSFYIDKTVFIEELENRGSFFKLWRPRRCGKSLVCSQLELYYDKLSDKKAVSLILSYQLIIGIQ
jgi:hypothetical protein